MERQLQASDQRFRVISAKNLYAVHKLFFSFDKG